MATQTIKADTTAFSGLLKDIKKKLGDTTPAMKIIGSIGRTSVVRNFEKSGRPTRWAKHSETTEKRRGKGAKILVNQGFAGGLLGSINILALKTKVKIGTPKIYGATMHYGAKKGSFGTVTATIAEHLRKKKGGGTTTVKQHQRQITLPWGDIPERKYLLLQKEDITEIGFALTDYLFSAD